MLHDSLILFAQQQPKFGQKGPPANPEEVLAFLAAYLGIVIGVGVCVIVAWLAVGIPFCMSMSKALNQVSESNRLMQPTLVWLFLIPCVNVIWFFFMVIQIPASLQKELQNRGMDDGSSYGKGMGLTSAILWAVYSFIWCIPFINYCSPLVFLVGIVFGIIFWVQVAGYSAKLAGGGKATRSRDDDDKAVLVRSRTPFLRRRRSG